MGEIPAGKIPVEGDPSTVRFQRGEIPAERDPVQGHTAREPYACSQPEGGWTLSPQAISGVLPKYCFKRYILLLFKHDEANGSGDDCHWEESVSY